MPLSRSARRHLAGVAFGLVAAGGLSGCSPDSPVDTGPFIGHLDTVLREDGSLHVLTRLRTSEDEGGGFDYHELLYAAPKGANYDVVPNPLGDGEKGMLEERSYQLAFDGDGRPVLLADTASGLVVHVLENGAWTTIAPSSLLSADVVAELETPGLLGAAWTGDDGDVRVMWGGSIFYVSSQLYQAFSIDKTCALGDDCTYDPTSDSTGEAARYDHDQGKYVLQRLACPNFCDAWTDVGFLGDNDQGGSSEALRRVFFHDRGGKGILVRPVSTPKDANNYAVIANDVDHQITVLSGGALYVGAGPRPGGGFAVASLGYDKALKLMAVGADDSIKQIELGSIDFGTQPIGVHVSDKAGEKVHVVVRESHDSVAHFVVSLPDGGFTKESIKMQ